VPVARYFIFVGGTLAALLLITGWCLPTPPAMFADQLAIDRAIIRIKSARKWPEKVVMDTSQPAMTAPAVEELPAAQSVRLPTDEARDRSSLQAMAQLKSDSPLVAVGQPTVQDKRAVARTARSKRRTARRLARAESGGDCCVFGWIDNGRTGSSPVSRRHAASPWQTDWPALAGKN
jgi:hypothetical protein